MIELRFPWFVILVLLRCVLPVNDLHAEAVNLVSDSEFELKEKESPWKQFPIRGIAKGSIERAKSGRTGFCRVVETREVMDGWMQLSAPIENGIEEGKDYELRAWIKGDRELHGVTLLIHDNTHWFPNDLATMGTTISKGWNEYIMRFRAGKSDAKANVGIRLAQEGKIWIDDVTLRPYVSPKGTVALANRVRNGSFECGMTGWTGERFTHSIEMVSDAPHGNHVLKLNTFNGGLLSSVLMNVEPGVHHVSLFAKAHSPTKVRLLLQSGYASQTPVGPETISNGPTTIALTELIELGTEWNEYRFTTDLPPVPNSSFYLTLIPQESVSVYLDAIQFGIGDSPRSSRRLVPWRASLFRIGRMESTWLGSQ